MSRQLGVESNQLADLTSPEVATRDGILAVPVGSTEQHGAHLPLSTDTDIAIELCQRLAQARDDVLVAPALPYGSSGEHAGFTGTISIGQQAIELVLIELGRSATDTFAHLVFVSAHGGNTDPAVRAVKLLRSESRDVLLFTPKWQGDPHAGDAETSMMLQLAPALVKMDRAVAGDQRPLSQTWPLMQAGGLRAVTETGVLGDPRSATAQSGQALLNALAIQLTEQVDRWRCDG